MSEEVKTTKPVERSRLMLLGALSAASLGGACLTGPDSKDEVNKNPALHKQKMDWLDRNNATGGDGGGGGGGQSH